MLVFGDKRLNVGKSGNIAVNVMKEKQAVSVKSAAGYRSALHRNKQSQYPQVFTPVSALLHPVCSHEPQIELRS